MVIILRGKEEKVVNMNLRFAFYQRICPFVWTVVARKGGGSLAVPLFLVYHWKIMDTRKKDP